MQPISVQSKLFLALLSLSLVLLVSCRPARYDIEQFAGPPNVKELLLELAKTYSPTSKELMSKEHFAGYNQHGLACEMQSAREMRATAVIDHFLQMHYKRPSENLNTLQRNKWIEFVKGDQPDERLVKLAKELDEKWTDEEDMEKRMNQFQTLLASKTPKSSDDYKFLVFQMQV